MFSNQSKETAIINNNLMSLNRAFGRDISNLRETEPKSLSSFVVISIFLMLFNNCLVE